MCRKSAAKKARSPVPLWIQFPEGNRGTLIFGGLHAKPVTSFLRTLRASARSQGFWLQAAAALRSSEERDIPEWNAPPAQVGTSPGSIRPVQRGPAKRARPMLAHWVPSRTTGPVLAENSPLESFPGARTTKTVHWTVFRALEPIEMERQGGRRNAAPTISFRNPDPR